MKAAVLTGYGDVDKLEIRDIPHPVVGPNEIKIRMAGASINPIDWKLRSGAYHAFMPLTFPAVLGRDASGTVVEVGPGVTAFRPGVRLLGLVNGGYAEFVVAPADAWAEVPEGMDLADAGALPLVLLTGAQLVEEAVGVSANDRLLITGAIGGVGRAAVFAAKSRGAKVYAGVRASQRDAAAQLGVEGVVALDDDRSLADLPPLDSIADTVGGESLKKVLGKLKPGGIIGSVVGESPDAKARGVTTRSILAHPDPTRLADLSRAVAAGKLLIPIARRFPLAETAAAQKLAERGAGGKVLLTG